MNRRWIVGKEVAGELEGRLRTSWSKLETCMKEQVSEQKVKEEARLRVVVRDLEEKKNTKAKQMTHISWLKDGNRNTHYFMAFASARKKANRVKELRREDGPMVKEGEEMTNYVYSFLGTLHNKKRVSNT